MGGDQLKTLEQILSRLRALAEPEKIKLKEQKFGIKSTNALGVYHKDLKELAKEIPKDNELALELFDSGIYEARLLCSKIFSPNALTEELMEKWVATFENWEICDSFCMGLFARSKWAVPKAVEWTRRTREFEKRAGFAIIAAYCMADKTAKNDIFEAFLPIIEREATDDRLYVKKAVNWALRNVGKRNVDLNQKVIECANRILKMDSKSANWIATNALKELTKEKVRISDYPRAIYRQG